MNVDMTKSSALLLVIATCSFAYSQIDQQRLANIDLQLNKKEISYGYEVGFEGQTTRSENTITIYSPDRVRFKSDSGNNSSVVYYESPHSAEVLEDHHVYIYSSAYNFDDKDQTWLNMIALPNVAVGRGMSTLSELSIKKNENMLLVSGKAGDGSIITATFQSNSHGFPTQIVRSFEGKNIEVVWRFEGSIDVGQSVFPKSTIMTTKNGAPGAMEKKYRFHNIKPVSGSWSNGWFKKGYTFHDKRVTPSVVWEYEEILAAAGPDVTLEELLALSQGKVDEINKRVSQFEKGKKGSFFTTPLFFTLLLLGVALVMMGKKLFSKAASR